MILKTLSWMFLLAMKALMVELEIALIRNRKQGSFEQTRNIVLTSNASVFCLVFNQTIMQAFSPPVFLQGGD